MTLNPTLNIPARPELAVHDQRPLRPRRNPGSAGIPGGEFSSTPPRWRGSQRSHALIVMLLLLLALSPTTRAADAQIAGAATPVIVERGLHHRVIQTATGGTYTELGTGMYYISQTGDLLESKEEILIDQNGNGVAEQGQHTARFSPSITDFPALSYTDPEGHVFQSRLLGLAYLDYGSGKSVLFCETKDSLGVVRGNRVIYTNSFTDKINADIIYTYKRASFEADVAIRSQLPSPAIYKLNPNTVRIQVWHELFDPPTPSFRTTSFIYQELDSDVRKNLSEPDFKDDFLSFGTMQFGHGTAFLIDSDAIRQAGIDVGQEVPVGKEWVTTRDETTGLFRYFLVESIEYATVQPLLDTLPTAALSKPNAKDEGLAQAKPRISTPRAQFLASLPPKHSDPISSGLLSTVAGGTGAQAAKASKPRLLKEPSNRQAAVVRKESKALLWDYITIITQTNFTFKADQTYWVSSAVTLSGTNTLESSVIKLAKAGSAQISISGSGATLLCNTSPFHPALFTAEDDQTIGQGIDQTQQNPSGYYGVYGLYFDAGSSGVLSSLHDARFLYAQNGVGYYHTASGTGHLVSNSQFYNCSNVISANYSSDVLLRNVLALNSIHFINGYNITARGENVTVNSANALTNGGNATLYLTNSLLYSIYDTGYSGGSSNSTASSNPFQTVGGSSAYLANNSPYRNSGTTNINATLAADLRQRTTYPPIVLTNSITVDTVLSPQAQRDTDLPDQGFHIDPLDFILSGGVILTNATLTLTGSVAVGISGSIGLKMQTGSHLNSVGSPINLNRLLRIESVQEQGGSTNAKTALFADDLVSGAMPEARLRFTDLPLLSKGGAQFSGGSQMGVLALQDCSLLGGGLTWNTNGASTRALSLTNNLFERTTNILGTGSDPLALHARNNLFKNGGIKLSPVSTNNWTWFDNAFDTAILTQNSNAITNGNNGYIYTASTLQRLTNGTSDVVITNGFTYQTGVLGIYFQPTNSNFINVGSRNATNSGLYHFCTTTNQVKETNSIVDIGLHYVAIDLSTGLPADFDGDGLFDYLEDLNGNGFVDPGETDWRTADTDGDGVSDYLEILQGRNPRIAGSIADTNNLINLRVYTPLK